MYVHVHVYLCACQRMRWLDSTTKATNMTLGRLWEAVGNRDASCAAVHGVPRSWTNWATGQQHSTAQHSVHCSVVSDSL